MTSPSTIIQEKVIEDNGNVTYKKYKKGKFLGKGGFAKVYEITDLETKITDAVKIVEKASLKKTKAKQKLMSEIKIHNSLHHDGIVKFKKYFEDKENVYIILELCPNSSLNDIVKRRKRLTEPEVKFYFYQLIVASQYMHDNSIIHRDLKLGNLFCGNKMKLKIGDFGLATKVSFQGEKKRTICGTPNYIAPEVLSSKIGHSYEVDLWSIGVILYTMLVGRPPFETSNVKTTYKRIKMNFYTFPDHITISREAKDLVQQLLKKEPE